jgi:hypothetical protein
MVLEVIGIVLMNAAAEKEFPGSSAGEVALGF